MVFTLIFLMDSANLVASSSAMATRTYSEISWKIFMSALCQTLLDLSCFRIPCARSVDVKIALSARLALERERTMMLERFERLWVRSLKLVADFSISSYSKVISSLTISNWGPREITIRDSSSTKLLAANC